MPKLNDTHLPSRISRIIDHLELGGAIVVRDVKAVLTAEQIAKVESEWLSQKTIRKGTRARTDDEKRSQGIINKRSLYIRELKAALVAAEAGMLAALHAGIENKKLRQTRKYLESVSKAILAGKSEKAARDFANNELTRAGLSRMDRRVVRRETARDYNVRDMEAQLKARFRAAMTKEELEQQAFIDDFEKWKNS